MNYKLSKQLKDAGFPNNRDSNSELPAWATVDGILIEPTLSELIEACGDDFYRVELLIKERGDDIVDERGWWAESKNHGRLGLTPEEAVAELWLALNT